MTDATRHASFHSLVVVCAFGEQHHHPPSSPDPRAGRAAPCPMLPRPAFRRRPAEAHAIDHAFMSLFRRIIIAYSQHAYTTHTAAASHERKRWGPSSPITVATITRSRPRRWTSRTMTGRSWTLRRKRTGSSATRSRSVKGGRMKNKQTLDPVHDPNPSIIVCIIMCNGSTK